MSKTPTILYAAVIGCIPSMALAQAENPPELAAGDIVVTAQRRAESAQRVPISLTALQSENLKAANIVSVEDLPKVASSLYVFRAAQAANTRLAIRGIGAAGNTAIEPSVGAYVDGIYVPRPGPLLAALNDVSSIEVLSGPQGTLFGRNASVGAISIHTAEPTDHFEGNASATYGNYDRARGAATVNLPITGDVATRFSVLYDRFDGYGKNAMTGQHFGDNRTLSLRGAVKAQITPSLSWILRGDYQQQRGDGQAVVSVDSATVTPRAAANFAARLNGLTPRLDDSFDRNLMQITDGTMRDNQWGIASDLALDIAGFTVRLLSGYRDWDNKQSERDIMLTRADLFGRQSTYRSKSHSEELQFQSPTGNRLNFTTGIYYFREDYRIANIINLGSDYCSIFIRNALPALLPACNAGAQMNAANNDFNQVTESFAVYGQGTFDITSNWDLTAGIRYSQDDKHATLVSNTNNVAVIFLNAPDNANPRFSGGKPTYRIATSWRPEQDVMLFASVSTGFKSGGFDAGTSNTLGNARVFRPETTTNYEVGAKTRFLDRRLTVNATLFRMDIDDYQIRSYDGTFYTVRNAGSLRQQGVEFEVSGRPTDELTLAVSGTRLGSKFTDYRGAPNFPGFGGTQDLTGSHAAFSPKWQGNASADYRRDIGKDLTLGLNAHMAFISDIDVGGGGDHNPQGIQPGYALLGARISIAQADQRWELAVSGENLTDKGYCTLKYGQTLGGLLGLNDSVTGGTVQRCVMGEPRTVRATLSFRF